MASRTEYAPVYQSTEAPEITRPTHSSKQPGRWTAWTEDGWLLEAASTLLGILFVVALFVVLQAYDGHPQPQFGEFLGSALTLNTVVAILSAAAGAALLYPVAECVSQWKWMWFSKEHRPLSHMAVFDEASRGMHGVFMLIWATKLR